MTKRLYRSPDGKFIGGVATGIAEYFDIDPVLVRLLFVVLTFINGIGILAYIILWIVVPYKPTLPVSTTATEAEGSVSSSDQIPAGTTASHNASASSFGIILIGLGVLFLLNNFIPSFSLRDFWPLILIAVGGGMLWYAIPKKATNEVES